MDTAIRAIDPNRPGNYLIHSIRALAPSSGENFNASIPVKTQKSTTKKAKHQSSVERLRRTTARSMISAVTVALVNTLKSGLIGFTTYPPVQLYHHACNRRAWHRGQDAAQTPQMTCAQHQTAGRGTRPHSNVVQNGLHLQWIPDVSDSCTGFVGV